MNSREHVFLYISKFGTNKLPQIYAATKDGAATEGVSGLVTWPMAVAEGTGEKDGETSLSRVVSHGSSSRLLKNGSPRRSRLVKTSTYR